MAEWPRVTIVTPSYNQAEFLEETIRSVLLQGYPNLEYIIVDGASRDGSVDIIRRYERWLTWWVSEPDEGQSDAINKGFRRASGEIIAWINSDDYYAPGAIHAAVKTLSAHPEAAMVYGDYAIVDEHSRLVSTSLERDRYRTFDFETLLNVRDFIFQPTVFMRHQVLRELGYLDTRLHYAMDYDLWLRIGERYPVIHAPRQILAYYRRHSAAKTTLPSFALMREKVMLSRRHGGNGPSAVRYLVEHRWDMLLDDSPTRTPAVLLEDMASEGFQSLDAATQQMARQIFWEIAYREACIAHADHDVGRMKAWLSAALSTDPARSLTTPGILSRIIEGWMGPAPLSAYRKVKRKVTHLVLAGHPRK
ncbi:MAG: hypothetical protein Kow0047_11660 [Anaerolineae bacterium]